MTRQEAITRNVLSRMSEGELFHANIVGCGLRCSALDRPLEPGESEPDPNEGEE